MSETTILIIEDDPDIRELIRYHLERDGYRTIEAETGENGLERVQEESVALILLDLMLPVLDGLEVCRRIRAESGSKRIPIIMLTAKGEESDIVAGLEVGADDYITKPFSPQVLLARIRAVLRRGGRNVLNDDEALQIHELAIHPARHEVRVAGVPVDLTRTEFEVLKYLVNRPGWVRTRGQIMAAVHGHVHSVTERAVDVQIVGLRKKLGEAGCYVETVRGVGYRFRE
ncbi:MAG: response regulator transcription factor [Candidatus Hydrogenedentes bacterium]|nr:response regulator transcription factor [Candidatus Hydrogenedentota bacterium]